MELYFLRHGDAEVALFNTLRADYERNLTEYGREEIILEAFGLRSFIDTFDVIFTSPLKRAYQTAEIFAKVFQCEDKLKVLRALEPPVSLDDLLEAVTLEGEVERVLCVGHAPSLAEMATEIITGMEEERFYPLKKGGLICIHMEEPDLKSEAELQYLLEPMFLSKLGEMILKEKHNNSVESGGENGTRKRELQDQPYDELGCEGSYDDGDFDHEYYDDSDHYGHSHPDSNKSNNDLLGNGLEIEV